MRSNMTLTRLAMAAAICVSPMLVGCDRAGLFGPNFSLNYVLPLGFGGAPGLYNPYGIVQAVVNSLLGSALPSGGGDESASPQSNPTTLDSATIGVAGQ